MVRWEPLAGGRSSLGGTASLGGEPYPGARSTPPQALLSMRHLWLLGLCFTAVACSESASADGAVRVVVNYGSYEPVCLRIIVSDNKGHVGQTDIPNGKFQHKEQRQVRTAVFIKPDWGPVLTIAVASLEKEEGTGNEARCSGNEIERLIRQESIEVSPMEFAMFTDTLQARDDDHDGYVLKTQDVAGTDCDDTTATIHPGVGCNDGNWCTKNDRCTASGMCQGEDFNPCESPGECKISKVINCSESAQCTVDADSSKTGQSCNGAGTGGKCRSDGVCSVFPFPPSNFDPDAVSAGDRSLDVRISCGSQSDPVIFDSTNGGWKFPQGCSPTMPVAQAPQGNEGVALLAMKSLTIELGRVLKLVGNRPVILAVYGDAPLSGALLADANFETPGAGGNRLGCSLQKGGDGTFSQGVGGGGGGGAFGQQGAEGGQFDNSARGGTAGAKVSSALSPLVGGCQGGAGGSASNSTNGGIGGAGGGALQLAVAGTLTANNSISVSGGGGRGGKGSSDGGENAEGGGGGGSGGGLLIEAGQLNLTFDARLIANGGAGGEGGDSERNNQGEDGEDGSQSAPISAKGGDSRVRGTAGGNGGAEAVAATPGIDGVAKGGAGGGGGGAGVIVLRGYAGCQIDPSCGATNNRGCDISPKVTPVCP
ncbi:hypothetical protein DB31_1364 [Hyalangium minutum]|uniref:Uncharacterized protein n=1 Tax=Hyalangium minutum TaxID=394096 RepID=A0A085WC35_9BACT|nr:hypothetical protein DB31_1364 [Hyalangium minutum]